MKRRIVINRTSALLVLIALLIACGDAPVNSDTAKTSLPYFGNHDVMLADSGNGIRKTDTVYFAVPFFAFTDQFGNEHTSDTYEGKIYVADYFFTTCPTICPVMSSQMSRLQSLLKRDDLLGEVKLLSHTVDPNHDTPEVLKAYGENLDADFEHWTFVTGEEDDLYFQARFGYFLTALPSDTAAGGFFHSDTFALIDRQRHIRGYYDGTSTESVDQLLQDIKLLIKLEDGLAEE